MSLSTAIQGLLVAQVPEYEISNDAIGYLSDFSGKVLNKLVHESSAINSAGISFGEVKTAINKIFPQAWASLISREVSNQVSHQQPDDKESMLKNEISDFEMIDDDHQSPKVERKNLGNLFLSADFIKSYLPASVASKIDTHGCMYLAVSLESVISKLIQQSRVALEQHEDPLSITKEAIEQAIAQDTLLSDLSNALSIIEQPIEDDTAEFEVVEDEKDEKQQEPTSDVEEENEIITEPIEKSAIFSAEELMPISKEEPTPIIEEEIPTSPIQVEERAPTPTLSVEVPAPALEDEQVSYKATLETEQTASESSPQLEPHLTDTSLEQEPLATPDFSSAKLIKAKKPVSELYGRCCPYFDATTFAIQMLSSIMELFLLHLVTETCNIARPHKRVMKHHVREALARLTSPQALPQNEIPQTDSSTFNECVNNSIITISNQTEWETNVKTYVSDAVMYISTKVLLVAASHARTTGDWVINSNSIAIAASHLVPVAPITKLIKMLQSSLEGEGPIITPPSAPRIRAAEMIYLTSLFKETPLQLDNQLLVVFMFLVSLSLHTLCCVK